MSNEVVEGQEIVVTVPELPMIPIEELKKLTAYVNEVKKTLMTKDKDYVVDGNRQYTTRSGFAKLAQGFALSDDPPEITKLEYDEPREFTFKHRLRREWKTRTISTRVMGFEARVKVINIQSGRYAHGEGACTVEELDQTNNMSPKWYHRCLATAKTRAWARAISNYVGSAEVSAEEMGLRYPVEEEAPPRKEADADYKVKDEPPSEPSRPAGIGPPPRQEPVGTTTLNQHTEKGELPQGVASLEELEGVFTERLPGHGKLLTLTPYADGFGIEPQRQLDEEIVYLVDHMVLSMGGEAMKREGQYGREWHIPLRKA